MTLSITDAARQAASQVNEQPQVVLVIEGAPNVYGAVAIKKLIRIGDPGLLIGDSWKIGGLSLVENQSDYIKVDSSTTAITQTLNQDKGIGATISSVSVALVDKNSEISKLISPGQVLTDVLGRRAKLYLGFAGTAYPDDYVIIFRGVIDEVDAAAGNVTFILTHPDRKKLQTIFPKCTPNLVGDITAIATSLVIDDPTFLGTRVVGPDGVSYDTNMLRYLKIGDELIGYSNWDTTLGVTTVHNLTRGQLGTTAATHSDGDGTESFYRLKGDPMTLALKLMLSGWAGPFQMGVAPKNFVFVDTTIGNIANSVYFEGIDLTRDYGLVIGDYLTITGATNGANNVANKPITDIQLADGGSYAVIGGGVSFVEEHETAALVDMRSQYDTLDDGLKMFGDEVDIAGHLRLFRLFLSGFSYDLYLKDDVDAKTFLDDEIYNPAAAYSLPRNGQASAGYYIGPIPSDNIATLSKDNITNPKAIKLQRSASKNFFNTIIYQFEEDVLTTNFLAGDIAVNGTSQLQIPVGNKTLTIPSKGMRISLQGKVNAQSAATRRLNRYAFGAEFFMGIQVNFRTGFTIEIGDVVILDSTGLFITDTKTGTRNASTKLYEVVNKSLDYKTGVVKLDLVDTNYSTANRYGLIGPSSVIKSGSSTTQFIIQSSFASQFGDNEYLKWSRYTHCPVKIRNSDFSILGHSTIQSFQGNKITLASALAFTPAAGQIMELDDYTNQTSQVKIRNGFMRDTAFGDGKSQYKML